MEQVIGKLKFSPKQEQKQVYHQAVRQITGRNQDNRKLDILREKPFPEKAVEVADIHINQCIKADDASEKDVQKQTAEKTDPHAFLPAPHEPEGRGDDDQKVRGNGCKSPCLKQGALQQKA